MEAKVKEAISVKMVGNTNRVGKTHSYKSKDKIKQSVAALIWWNNGEKEVRSRVQPVGFVKGRISNKGTVWINNGAKETQIDECEAPALDETDPEGWVRGRLFNLSGYHWYSGNTHNEMRKEYPDNLIHCGRLHPGMVPSAFKKLPAYLESHPNYHPKDSTKRN